MLPTGMFFPDTPYVFAKRFERLAVLGRARRVMKNQLESPGRTRPGFADDRSRTKRLFSLHSSKKETGRAG